MTAYKIEDMRHYSVGLKAQKAVTSVLNQVGENLKTDGYEYVLIDGNEK